MYGHLTCVWPQGQASIHNINSILTHHCPNTLVVYCPACPEVGFNVFREFLTNLSLAERCVLVFFISAYIKSDQYVGTKSQSFSVAMEIINPDNVALADGNGYFSDMELFKAYLEVVGDSDEVRVVLM